MSAPYPIEALANTLLTRSEERGINVDPMKLQKLMYVAHGYYLAASGSPLIDEAFEAWQYGPVAPTIYHEFKHCGSHPIKRGARASRTIFELSDEDELDMSVDHPYLPDDDTLASQILDYVLDTYGAKSAVYLSDLTHKINSPWEKTKRVHSKMRNVPISNDLIAEHYKQLLDL